jgi:hypothetical protein
MDERTKAVLGNRLAVVLAVVLGGFGLYVVGYWLVGMLMLARALAGTAK